MPEQNTDYRKAPDWLEQLADFIDSDEYDDEIDPREILEAKGYDVDKMIANLQKDIRVLLSKTDADMK